MAVVDSDAAAVEALPLPIQEEGREAECNIHLDVDASVSQAVILVDLTRTRWSAFCFGPHKPHPVETTSKSRANTDSSV